MKVDLAMLAGRIIVVFQLLPNGLRKIENFELTAAMMGGAPPQMIGGRLFPAQEPLFHFPVPEFFLACSITFDLLLTLFVIVGFCTRSAAAFLMFYIVLAATIYHSDIRGSEDLMALTRILPFLGCLLLIAMVGGGRFTIDGWRARRESSAPSPAAGTSG